MLISCICINIMYSYIKHVYVDINVDPHIYLKR